MIKLTRKNMNEVVQNLVSYYLSSRYSNECFSSGDVRREMTANDELNAILDELNKVGVNIETEFSNILNSLKKGELYFVNNTNFVECDDDFEVKLKFKSFERYLSHKAEHLLVNDEPIIDIKPFRKALNIGDTRFSYEKWDNSKESFDYLLEYCSVFKSAEKIIKDICEGYGTHKNPLKVQAIHCIRDNYYNPKDNNSTNCSSYMLVLNNCYNTELHEDCNPKIFISMGGHYKDAQIIQHWNKVEHILPLEGCRTLGIRPISSSLNKNIESEIKMLKEYERQLSL